MYLKKSGNNDILFYRLENFSEQSRAAWNLDLLGFDGSTVWAGEVFIPVAMTRGLGPTNRTDFRGGSLKGQDNVA